MALIEVFRKNIVISYQSRFISKASFLSFVCTLISLLFPLVFAYCSRGFLLERAIFHEQPDVRLTGEYVFSATTRTNSSGTILCSSSYEDGETIETCSNFKYDEIDANRDGKMDRLVVSLEVNLPSIESEISYFDLILLLDFKLHGYFCRLNSQVAIILQQFLPFSMTDFTVSGDLSIVQREPIFCHERFTNKHFNSTIFSNITYENTTETNSTEDFNVQDLIMSYSNRNFTTRLTNIYKTFSNNDPQLFKLEIMMQIPEIEFLYQPRLWQTLKLAWIQYLAIYIIINWILQRFKRYVFKNRLVLFYKYDPLKRKD